MPLGPLSVRLFDIIVAPIPLAKAQGELHIYYECEVSTRFNHADFSQLFD